MRYVKDFLRGEFLLCLCLVLVAVSGHAADGGVVGPIIGEAQFIRQQGAWRFDEETIQMILK